MKKITGALIITPALISSLSVAVLAAGNNTVYETQGGVLPWWAWTIIAVVILAALVFLFLFLKTRKSMKAFSFDQTDNLTGIGNKRYMRTCYDQRTNISRKSYCLSYIAFDAALAESKFGIDPVNEVQKFAAKIMAEALGDYDYAARTENGVFAFCFKPTDVSKAGQKINSMVEILNRYQYQKLNEISSPFRAGMYMLGKSGEDFETAFLNAKLGYRQACENKTNVCVCTEEVIRTESMKNRLGDKLTRAIDDNQFDPFLQFIYSVKDGKFVGAEVLSRWNSPVEGFIMPAHYINDMRTTGVIVKFDYYMLDKTCEILEKLGKMGYGDLRLSCNITRITISEPDFVSKLKSTVKRYNFKPENLTVEITEDAFFDNRAVAFKNIIECKQVGIKVAIDDFGVGQASVGDLCDYPIDIIKVDRHIINKSGTDRGDALISGIISLAHKLGVEVVCEGVETDEQNSNVLADGCDYIQGYLYSYVFPIGEALEHYKKSVDEKAAN